MTSGYYRLRRPRPRGGRPKADRLTETLAQARLLAQA
jgi:hypothetical protein